MNSVFLALGIFGVICFFLVAIVMAIFLTYTEGVSTKGMVVMLILLLFGGAGLWCVGVYYGTGKPAKKHLTPGTYTMLHSFSGSAGSDVCYLTLEQDKDYFFYAVPPCALKEIECGVGMQWVRVELAEKCGVNLRPSTVLNPTMNR